MRYLNLNMTYCITCIILLSVVILLVDPCSATADGATGKPKDEVETSSLLEGHNHVVVCYVSILTALHPDESSFSVRDLDPSLCTHLMLSDIGIRKSSGTLRMSKYYNNAFLDWVGVKKLSPHINVTFSVGEVNDTTSFSTIAANTTLRKVFIESVINTTVAFGFDGVDINLAYTKSSDKMSIVTLVKELQESLTQRGVTLSITLSAKHSIIDATYDIKKLSSLIQYMHIMCFDYHGAWDAKTGPNAPLQSSNFDDKLTVMSTIQNLKSQGAPAYKLVLGVPMYGHTFELIFQQGDSSSGMENSYGFNSKALTTGFQGNFTKTDGFMAYNEICLEINAVNSSWKKSWDDVSKTPYAQAGKQWISYDDVGSIKKKAFFAIQEGLAGLMAWRVDLDDFRGDCSEKSMAAQRFPLLSALNVAMTQALDNPYVYTIPTGNDSKDLSIPIGITLAVLLCAMLAMFIRLIHLRIHSNCPTFF